ncbi:helix-turn-helix domain-containing protein [Actinophytocola sp.]|uniref:helix-turn-helix domain-containing protein n=1 Tax=Actinophytocola sp. TaxID=1872138 RepID=UPI003C77DCBB
MTVVQAAARLEITRSALSRFENGIGGVTVHLLRSMMDPPSSSPPTHGAHCSCGPDILPRRPVRNREAQVIVPALASTA